MAASSRTITGTITTTRDKLSARSKRPSSRARAFPAPDASAVTSSGSDDPSLGLSIADAPSLGGSVPLWTPSLVSKKDPKDRLGRYAPDENDGRATSGSRNGTG